MRIETCRLVISDLKKEDAFRIYEYRSKKEVEQYQSFKNYTLQEAKQTVLMDSPKNRAGEYQLGIYLNDLLIGDLYINIDDYKNTFIGYTLDSDYWRYGYGVEAVSSLIKFLYNAFKIGNFYAYIDSNNLASIKLVSKIGFRYIKNNIYGLNLYI